MSEAQAPDIAARYGVVKVLSDKNTGGNSGAYAADFTVTRTGATTPAVHGTDDFGDWPWASRPS